MPTRLHQHLQALCHSTWCVGTLVRFRPSCSLDSSPKHFRDLLWFTLDLDVRQAIAFDLHGVHLDIIADHFPSAQGNPVCFPFAWTCLWSLARWGHDHSSTGRSARHFEQPCCMPFVCQGDDHISVYPDHRAARASWALLWHRRHRSLLSKSCPPPPPGWCALLAMVTVQEIVAMSEARASVV